MQRNGRTQRVTIVGLDEDIGSVLQMQFTLFPDPLPGGVHPVPSDNVNQTTTPATRVAVANTRVDRPTTRGGSVNEGSAPDHSPALDTGRSAAGCVRRR